MYKIIDLTYPHDETAASPGHPKTTLFSITSYKEHGRSNSGLTSSMHTGTHVDSPAHFYEHGISIDKIPLENLFGPAVLFDIKGMVQPKEAIEVKHLQGKHKDDLVDLENKIVLIYTGWIEQVQYGTEEFYRNNPALHPDTASWFVKQKIKALGVDFPIDFIKPVSKFGGGELPIHKILLAAGIPIIENLVNLGKISEKRFIVCAAPLKLVNSDGALARVFGIEGTMI